jgi:hypothetical protein
MLRARPLRKLSSQESPDRLTNVNARMDAEKSRQQEINFETTDKSSYGNGETFPLSAERTVDTTCLKQSSSIRYSIAVL